MYYWEFNLYFGQVILDSEWKEECNRMNQYDD